MNIYFVEYWTPFPDSEYGGVIVAMANSREQLAGLLKEAHGKEWTDNEREAMEAVKVADCLTPEDISRASEPAILEAFLT